MKNNYIFVIRNPGSFHLSLRDNVSNWLVSRIRISFSQKLIPMKILHLLVIGVLVSSCTTEKSTSIILENTSDKTRIDAGITISREEISSWAEISDELLPALMNPDSTFVPSQVDDLDGDGTWDELFVVTDLAGKEQKEVTLAFYERSAYPATAVRTNIRFANKKNNYKEVTSGTRETHAVNTITGEVWQMEGIAFENDYVGFRNYFDQRNGMDIFGKLINSMVLDEVGAEVYPNYHDFDPEWGMDVLKVGSSLGSGSIAYLYNDSLFRVGDNGIGTCDILVEGPLRSIFQFKFSDWDMDGTTINVTHTISIQAGTFYFDNEVSYSGIEEEPEFVSGIVNMKSEELFEVEAIAGHKAFYTHDLQAEDTTLLTMAILVNEDGFAGTSETPESGKGITQTYCIHQHAKTNDPVSFRFYSFWEMQNDKWADPKACEEWMIQDAAFKDNPVRVSLK